MSCPGVISIWGWTEHLSNYMPIFNTTSFTCFWLQRMQGHFNEVQNVLSKQKKRGPLRGRKLWSFAQDVSELLNARQVCNNVRKWKRSECMHLMKRNLNPSEFLLPSCTDSSTNTTKTRCCNINQKSLKHICLYKLF